MSRRPMDATRQRFLDCFLEDCSLGDLVYLRKQLAGLTGSRAADDAAVTPAKKSGGGRGRTPGRQSGGGRGRHQGGALEETRRSPPQPRDDDHHSPPVAQSAEPSRPGGEAPGWNESFYALYGQRELCEIKGGDRQLQVIGKTEHEITSMARRPVAHPVPSEPMVAGGSRGRMHARQLGRLVHLLAPCSPRLQTLGRSALRDRAVHASAHRPCHRQGAEVRYADPPRPAGQVRPRAVLRLVVVVVMVVLCVRCPDTP